LAELGVAVAERDVHAWIGLAQVGCTLAAYVVETVGTQEYSFTPDQFLSRVHDSYGSDAANEIGKYLG